MHKELKPVRNMERNSQAESDYMNELRKAVVKIDADYVKYVADNFDYVDMKTSTLSYMQRMRHMHMIGACVRPLQQGLNVNGIVSAIGTYAGICLFDKTFVKDVKQTVATSLLPVVKAKVEKSPDNSAYRTFADMLSRAANDGRLPLDADTVAVTQLAFCERAYNDMRKSGADINLISKQYDDAINTLYELAHKDGVSQHDINHSLNFALGKLSEYNSDVIQYFNETLYDGVHMSPYKVENRPVMSPDGVRLETQHVWSGEFQTRDGDAYNNGFTPRVPTSIESYESMISDFVKSQFIKGLDNYHDAVQDAAFKTCVDFIHESQQRDLRSIDIKLKDGIIDNREANDMRRKVRTLDGFNMSILDIPDELQDSLLVSSRDASLKAFADDTDNSKHLSAYKASMLSDGFSNDDFNNACSMALSTGAYDCCEHLVNDIIKQAIQHVQDENEARTRVHHRDYNFDDMFNNDNSEFVY